MIPIIFCLSCDTIMLDLRACPACGWRRPAATSQVGKELWRTELNSKLIKPGCYATIAGAYFCVSTEDGTLIALDLESGKRVWEQSLGEGEMAYALAADASHVFVGTTDQRPIPLNGKILRSLDARTGALLWQYPTRAD